MAPAATFDDKFTSTYDASRRQLVACWRYPATDIELYEQYAELMALAETHDCCRFWQLDMVARNWHTPAFGRWFGHEFAPLAHAALGKPLFIAYILEAQHQPFANSPGTQATQSSCATHDVYPFFFEEEGSAQEWLAHQQAHDEDTRTRPTR